ncbi:hypothetical protein BYT27DRAFT_7183880 [Phlegmacium glaucopus]|nr:hypothetical protein BYT27DRAFT_7183880 [Phlegmacium glaucopus]
MSRYERAGSRSFKLYLATIRILASILPLLLIILTILIDILYRYCKVGIATWVVKFFKLRVLP